MDVDHAVGMAVDALGVGLHLERVEERVARVDAVDRVPVVDVRHGRGVVSGGLVVAAREEHEREAQHQDSGDRDGEGEAALVRHLAVAAGAASRATFLADEALPIGIER